MTQHSYALYSFLMADFAEEVDGHRLVLVDNYLKLELLKFNFSFVEISKRLTVTNFHFFTFF